jgi:hypothetical protein
MKGFLGIFAFFVLIVLSCNGAVIIESPEMTDVFMGSNHLVIFWERNELIENSADFAGYNVYINTDSSALLVDDGEELNKFNSQLVQDTTFQANALLQDSVYFIQVRTVNTENKVGSYNSDTPFLMASPRPEFTVTMHIAAYGQQDNDSSAVRFSDGFVMPDSTMADSGADMWVAALNDTVNLVSPHQHPLYGLLADRITRFTNTGTGAFDSISTVIDEPAEISIQCMVGDIVIAKSEDGNYVKLYIDAIDLQDDVIVILYAYQNIPEVPRF